MSFTYREPGAIIADVIQEEMTLLDTQVLFTNQKWFIPTNGLLVVVSYVGPSKVISNSNEYEDDNHGGLTEVQTIVMAHMVQVDIMGYSNESRQRKEEIVMALMSVYAQRQQELYGMQIARQPSPFLDTSFLEETKMVTRYTTTVVTTSINQKRKNINDIYTDFSRAVPPTLTVNA